MSQPEQSRGRNDRADSEQTERRETVGKRSSAKAQDEHNGRSIDEHPLSSVSPEVLQNRRHERRDPAISAKFGCCQQDHDQQEENKYRLAEFADAGGKKSSG